MSTSEHPLVSQGIPNTEPNLVGQGLESQAVVGFGQPAGDSLVGAMFLLDALKEINGLLKPSFQEVIETLKGYKSVPADLLSEGDMKTVYCVKEKEGPYLVVQVVAFFSEAFKLLALLLSRFSATISESFSTRGR